MASQPIPNIAAVRATALIGRGIRTGVNLDLYGADGIRAALAFAPLDSVEALGTALLAVVADARAACADSRLGNSPNATVDLAWPLPPAEDDGAHGDGAEADGGDRIAVTAAERLDRFEALGRRVGHVISERQARDDADSMVFGGVMARFDGASLS